MPPFLLAAQPIDVAKTPRARLFCALATALLWWLATLPMGWFALGWVAPLPLLCSLYGLNARQRFFAGWRCGFLSFALLNWWIVVAITRGSQFIGVPSFFGFFLGLLAASLVSLLHGSLVALVALLWNPPTTKIVSRPESSTRFPLEKCPLWIWPIFVASLWAFLDFLRGQTPMAHSWGALAYTQWRDVALIQIAAFFGQHGLTFVCVWFAASLALWLRPNDNLRRQVSLHAPIYVFLTLHLWGAWRIHRVDAAQEIAPKLRVLLVKTVNSTSLSPPQTSFAQAYALTIGALQNSENAKNPELAKSENRANIDENSRAEIRENQSNETKLISKNAQFDTNRQSEKSAENLRDFGNAHLEEESQIGADNRNANFADAKNGEELGAKPQIPANENSRESESNRVNESARNDESRAANARNSRAKYDLIVWPETLFSLTRRVKPNANPQIEYSIGRDIDGLEARQLDELCRRNGVSILCGVDVMEIAANANSATENSSLETRFNEALLFDGSGRVQSRAKNHLVPFGERAPWSEVLPFLRVLAPSPAVESGENSTPMTLKIRSGNRVLDSVQFGTLVCFESCFPQPSRVLQANGARALFVLTNDDFFGGTEAPFQHAAMMAVRAVENDAPVMQSSNGGYVAAVDRTGRFVIKSTVNSPQIAEVQIALK